MNKNKVLFLGILALVILLGVAYTLTNSRNSAANKDTNVNHAVTQASGELATAGSYEAYAPEKVALASDSHHVVLFFRASWCPTCRAVDADIRSHLSQIPANLAILDVNYDNSTALKQKYGVTYQHTFVQVDKDGNLLKKWAGSPTLAALVAEVK
jgi:thiol-disulfide isomerase/thioredoxin